MLQWLWQGKQVMIEPLSYKNTYTNINITYKWMESKLWEAYDYKYVYNKNVEGKQEKTVSNTPTGSIKTTLYSFKFIIVEYLIVTKQCLS